MSSAIFKCEKVLKTRIWQNLVVLRHNILEKNQKKNKTKKKALLWRTEICVNQYRILYFVISHISYFVCNLIFNDDFICWDRVCMCSKLALLIRMHWIFAANTQFLICIKMYDFLIANWECVYGKTILKRKMWIALAEKHFVLQVTIPNSSWISTMIFHIFLFIVRWYDRRIAEISFHQKHFKSMKKWALLIAP